MKLSKEKIYSLWSIAIIAVVILAVFSLFFSACARQDGGEKDRGFTVESDRPRSDRETETPEESAEPTEPAGEENPPENGAAARLGLSADAGRSYLDKFVFLGDSTTYGIGYYYDQGYTELCPPSQVWTPKSGTLTLSYHSIATIVDPETEEELSILDMVEKYKPEYMLITLGVNGIAFMDENWFITDYTGLVQGIRETSPSTRIILNSIYPVAASYKYQSDINNEKIRAANEWIERVAEQTGCRYLHSYESVIGADGNLPESAHNGDGIHLNGESFTKVMEYIRTHAWS